VIDAAPAQIPAPEAVKRALDVLKSAKRPLIILGKGAAYAQADAQIKAFVEKTGVPFLPMSMAKGLLPDTASQCAGAARSTVLAQADVVMLIGARLNWLLSHGKGKTWGEPYSKKFIQIDIEPKEMDSNLEIAAPLSAISAHAFRPCSIAWAATGPQPRPIGSTPSRRSVTRTSPRWRRG